MYILTTISFITEEFIITIKFINNKKYEKFKIF